MCVLVPYVVSGELVERCQVYRRLDFISYQIIKLDIQGCVL